MESFEEERLRAMSTPALLRHALEEARLLAKAELLHARYELKSELREARTSGILLGAALALALSGLALLLGALAMVLPLTEVGGLLLVGASCLLLAAGVGLWAWRKTPKKPLPKTRRRLKEDLVLTREQFA